MHIQERYVLVERFDGRFFAVLRNKYELGSKRSPARRSRAGTYFLLDLAPDDCSCDLHVGAHNAVDGPRQCVHVQVFEGDTAET